jgi:hypothetical protein
MINPLRSEEDAFRFTVVVAVLVAPIALTAIIWSSGAALAVAGGLAFGIAFALLVIRRESAPERASMRRRRFATRSSIARSGRTPTSTWSPRR